MMINMTNFVDGLSAFFAEGTALGALMTFLIANLPSFFVTIATLKRWISGATRGMEAVQADCKQLARIYETDVARLQSAVDAQHVTINRMLAVLALAFGNSKLDPTVRAEIEKLICGAATLQDGEGLSALLSKTAQAAGAHQKDPLPSTLAAFETETVLLQG